MIAVQERQLNIKDLQLKEPGVAKRVRPIIDFSGDISYFGELVPYIPNAPKAFCDAVIQWDKIITFFGDEEQMTVLSRNGIRSFKDYLTEEFTSNDMDGASISLLLYDTVLSARTENRDPSRDELETVSTTLQQLALWRGGRYGKGLQEIAKHPELLLFMSEIITFQESTFSIPDYTDSEFQAVESPKVPTVRRF